MLFRSPAQRQTPRRYPGPATAQLGGNSGSPRQQDKKREARKSLSGRVSSKLPLSTNPGQIQSAVDSVVYPSSKTTDARYDSHRRDALLLYAHCKASRDFFVTSDGAILNAAARLEKEWSITVSGIRDYVARN